MAIEIIETMRMALSNSYSALAEGFPSFLSGLLILLVGVLLGSIVRSSLSYVFGLLKLDRWSAKSKTAKEVGVAMWQELLGEIARWAVIILFLVPALETWGLPGFTALINQILGYLPNVFIAAVIGFVGIVLADLSEGVIKQSFKGIGATSAQVMAGVSRYAIIFFTALVVLSQLGVAADLIRVLFTGIVAMLALAGGLAFGLGGQEAAREILASLRKRLG